MFENNQLVFISMYQIVWRKVSECLFLKKSRALTALAEDVEKPVMHTQINGFYIKDFMFIPAILGHGHMAGTSGKQTCCEIGGEEWQKRERQKAFWNSLLLLPRHKNINKNSLLKIKRNNETHSKPPLRQIWMCYLNWGAIKKQRHPPAHPSGRWSPDQKKTSGRHSV